MLDPSSWKEAYMANDRKPIYVLGTGLSHDGSACLLKDGRICVAIEKERITRKKHDGYNDSDAIRYCLDAEGIRLSDLTLIVQNANFGMFEFGSEWFDGRRVLSDEMPVVSISHHLAHAYSAFGTSPFEDGAIWVVDGCGSGLDECIDLEEAIIPERPTGETASIWFEKESYYKVENGEIKTIYKDFAQLGMILKEYPLYPKSILHTIGGLYAAVSNYIFRGMDDSGKLMGLAPYGRPGIYDFEIFDLREGRVFLRYDWIRGFRKPARTDEDFRNNFQYYADLAYWVQSEVERAILYLVNARYQQYPSRNLCYAGGVALNAVANARILKEGPFENIYIQPAAGDNGLAIGCAYYGWLKILKQKKVSHDGSTYLGKRYHSNEIESVLSRHAHSIDFSHSTDCIAETVSHLKAGNTVGWFQGRSEFGPRALGNRSILADPQPAHLHQYINTKVKFREDFRPFAPSVLLEDLHTYFECDRESPYMLLVAPVREEWRSRIPNVVHRNGTARIQTVTQQMNPLYYRLLREFKQATGLGMLLNTSLNRRRMPIVETPEEAVNFFLASGLHVLVIDGFIVEKLHDHAAVATNLSTIFDRCVHLLDKQGHSITTRLHGVYQFNITSDKSWTLYMANEKPHVMEGQHSRQADVIVEANEIDFCSACANPSVAASFFHENRIRVTGDQKRALQVLELLSRGLQ
jgi:carbamoyltransferase